MWKYSEMRQLGVETNYRSRPPRKMVKDRQRRCGVGDEFSNLCVFGTWLQCIFCRQEADEPQEVAGDAG